MRTALNSHKIATGWEKEVVIGNRHQRNYKKKRHRSLTSILWDVSFGEQTLDEPFPWQA